MLEDINVLSYRSFVEKYLPKVQRDEATEVADFLVAGNQVRVNGNPVIRFEEGADPEIKKELRTIPRKVYDIKARGNTPLVIDTYDEKEVRAIDRIVKKYQSSKQIRIKIYLSPTGSPRCLVRAFTPCQSLRHRRAGGERNMKTVYLVMSYDGDTLHGVYESKADAEQKVANRS